MPRIKQIKCDYCGQKVPYYDAYLVSIFPLKMKCKNCIYTDGFMEDPVGK